MVDVKLHVWAVKGLLKPCQSYSVVYSLRTHLEDLLALTLVPMCFSQRRHAYLLSRSDDQVCTLENHSLPSSAGDRAVVPRVDILELLQRVRLRPSTVFYCVLVDSYFISSRSSSLMDKHLSRNSQNSVLVALQTSATKPHLFILLHFRAMTKLTALLKKRKCPVTTTMAT